MSSVAVVGNLARDRIEGGPPRPGGGSYFAALALGWLGKPGRVYTRCAPGDRPLFDPLLHTRVAVTILPSATTAAFEHTYDGDTRSSTITCLGEPWAPSDAGLLDGTATWVHIAPLTRADFPAGTVAAFARDGRRVSFDGQGLVRAARIGALVLDAAFDPATLEHVTALKLSDEEARTVAGGEFTAATARTLGVPEIVVTHGSRGSTLWREGVPTAVAAHPISGVDATGAGDVFMLGYAIARDAGTEPLQATRAASELVTRLLRERAHRP
jgi:sugar/nucleoside kinase (ribokinase family)